MSNTASKTTKTVVPSKATTFEVTDTFKEAMPKAQNAALGAWLAANPTARIVPIAGVVAQGCLPAYLRSPNGKRADIVRMMVKGMPVAKFLVAARLLGGGYTDMVAGLLGGYSRSSPTWGKPSFTITSAA